MKIIVKNSNIALPLLAILTTILTGTIKAEQCKQTNGMWGDVDPNIFYICDNATNTAIQLQCAVGRGFFNGLGYYGCVPYDQWPACISVGSHIQVCDTAHMMEPWESVDPNKFNICRVENELPQLVSCESGKGFINVTTGGGNVGNARRIVGCTNWEKWRIYMQCTDYY